jgi:hypothetical protein
MATRGKWYLRRFVSAGKIGGMPLGAKMDGGPLWVPELLRYVCVWYTTSAVWVRYLNSAEDLFTSSGVTVGRKEGSFYYGGYIYILRTVSGNIVLSKVSVSTWAATDVATIQTATDSGDAAGIFFDGTSTIFHFTAVLILAISTINTTFKKSDISTPSIFTTLGSFSDIDAHLPGLLGVDGTSLFFAMFEGSTVRSRHTVAIAGGTPATTTWLMFGRPGYHTKGSTILFDKTEANSWNLGYVPSSLVVLEETTPLFIFLSGTTICFMEGTTLKYSIASGAVFKSNTRDSYMRSDGAKETQGIGLVVYSEYSVSVELAPMGRELI